MHKKNKILLKTLHKSLRIKGLTYRYYEFILINDFLIIEYGYLIINEIKKLKS